MDHGSEAIEDHEILFRRIPVVCGFYDPSLDTKPSPMAFRPTQHDTSGLSIYREKYKSIDQVGCGRAGKKYYVAVLKAGDIRQLGMEVVPRPLENDPGHCEIVDLTYANRKAMPYAEWQGILAERLCKLVCQASSADRPPVSRKIQSGISRRRKLLLDAEPLRTPQSGAWQAAASQSSK